MQDDDGGLFSMEEVGFVETPEMIIKKEASQIFTQWVARYGKESVENHGRVIGSIKQALSTGIAANFIQEAVLRLGYERMPITSASIQMQLSIMSKQANYSGNSSGSFDDVEYE